MSNRHQGPFHLPTLLLLCVGVAHAVGCDAESDDGAAGATAADADAEAPPPVRTATPYAPDIEPIDAQPTLDPATLSDIAARHLPRLAQSELGAIPAIFETFLEAGTDDCPFVERAEQEDGTLLTFEGGCETADGARFDGFAQLTTYQNRRESDDEPPATGFTIEAGGVRMERPDGRFFEADGYADSRRLLAEAGEEDGGDAGGHLYLQGSFLADPETAAGNDWLDGRLSGRLERGLYRDEGGYYFEMSATMTLGEGPASALSVGRLRINSWLCTDEPAGTLSIRERDGVWHDLVFDGFVEEEEEAEPSVGACDGCATWLVAGGSGTRVCDADGWIAALMEVTGR